MDLATTQDRPKEGYQNFSLGELLSLYKGTIEKLNICAQYIPTDNVEENLLNLEKEEAQVLLQSKIMQSVLNHPITTMSDMMMTMEFWNLCVLSQKKTSDYESSDFLISKSLDFMKAS